MNQQPAVDTRGLTKRYGNDRVALSDVTVSIGRGEIHGLVGENGAGKTTLMRILVGLVRPTSGAGTVLGHPFGAAGATGRVGSLIEQPQFSPFTSGRRNLEQLCRYWGVDRGDVDRVLGLVGLTDRADDRFSRYSLGMKQRLGVAAALLGSPDLLVLDEPTNGLDPQAIVAMRDLLERLRDSGTTVLVSSHHLAELEQICDRLTILHQGKVLLTGTLADLRAPRGRRVLARVSPVAAAVEALRSLPGVTAVTESGDGALVLDCDGATPAEISRHLVTRDIDVLEMREETASLEALYLNMAAVASTAGAPEEA